MAQDAVGRIPALNEPGLPQHVQVVGQRGARHANRLLDSPYGRLPLCSGQEEEDLQARQVSQGPERVGVTLVRHELRERE